MRPSTHACWLRWDSFIHGWQKTAVWPQDVTGLQRAPDRRLGCVSVSWKPVLDEACGRDTREEINVQNQDGMMWHGGEASCAAMPKDAPSRSGHIWEVLGVAVEPSQNVLCARTVSCGKGNACTSLTCGYHSLSMNKESTEARGSEKSFLSPLKHCTRNAWSTHPHARSMRHCNGVTSHG